MRCTFDDILSIFDENLLCSAHFWFRVQVQESWTPLLVVIVVIALKQMLMIMTTQCSSEVLLNSLITHSLGRDAINYCSVHIVFLVFPSKFECRRRCLSLSS